MHRYRYEHDPAEMEPLDNPNAYNSPGHSQTPGQQGQQWQHHWSPPQQQPPSQQYYDLHPPSSDSRQYQSEGYRSDYNQNPSPPRAARGAKVVGAHPDSAFGRLRSERRLSREQKSFGGGQVPYLATAAATAAPMTARPELVSPISPPGGDGRYVEQPPAPMQTIPPTNITPGSDNFGDSAAGGMAGIAYHIADQNGRESGLAAIRGADPNQPDSSRQPQAYYGGDQWQQQPPYPPQQRLRPAYGAAGAHEADRNSHSSLAGLGAAGVPPGSGSPGQRTPSRSPNTLPSDVYTDDPYSGYSRTNHQPLGVVNPHEIDDDGDDGLEYGRRPHRMSMLSLGGGSNRSGHTGAAAVAGAGATAGAVAGGLAASRAAAGGRGPGYGPVQNGGAPSGSYFHDDGGAGEKSARWAGNGADKSDGGLSKKWKWVIIIGVALVIVAAIVVGVLFGVVFKRGGNGSAAAAAGGGSADNQAAGGGFAGQTAEEDLKANGDLDANSAEIKALMNNPNLHKVFPGMDYTPLHVQYPECVHAPPSQNNITRDVAVLSQMTNTIRLYGTDCNQTQMVLHSIDKLGLKGKVKVWLGVWQDNNETTNARQLHQMWDILDVYGAEPFKGLIVANEILFREQMTPWALGQLLTNVRTNLTNKGMSLPVATSDLGDKWTSDLALVSDYIMANIHPFFAGENAKTAAKWTHTFWEGKAGSFFKSDKSHNVIAEIGWPSQGGNHCGQGAPVDAVCPDKAVAGIDEMNQLMEDFVCSALNDGTNYFWFEAFDEPWKVAFNNGTRNWEDQWGLMDVNRKLKPGLKIPDCGGKTV